MVYPIVLPLRMIPSCKSCICTVYAFLTHPWPVISVRIISITVWHFYRPQTKLREGNVFTPVSHCVHRRMSASESGGSAPGFGGVCLWVQEVSASGSRWDTYPLDTPPGCTPTVNKRAVRILLECFFVEYYILGNSGASISRMFTCSLWFDW